MFKNKMSPPPIVTGISPKEGPPGTRVTLRGEFLGYKPQDLKSITICGCDCTLSAEWISQNKIIARSGLCKGRGDIIVTTYSGGIGTSTVQFRGYHETVGPMKESAVWVEEEPIQYFAWGRRAMSQNSYQEEDPLGLSVEEDGKKYPEDELVQLFGDCASELSSDKFHPGRFLLQHHHATTLDDLKAAQTYLRRKISTQKEGQVSFLKANAGSIIEQLNTIIQLKNQFDVDQEEAYAIIESLESIVQKVETQATDIAQNMHKEFVNK